MPPLPSAAERLAAHLVEQPSGCLEWAWGATARHGYGAISFNGKQIGAHQLAWTLVNGPIPDGLHICHHCDNPPCCQTDPTEGYPEGHLFVGTRSDNMSDAAAKGRIHNQNVTHCPKGHEYTEANTYLMPRGGRVCRTCKNAASRADYWKKRRLALVEAA